MSDYVTLMGAEQVQSAGYAMKSAADDMQRAASTIADAVFRLQQMTYDWQGIATSIAESVAAIAKETTT